MALFFRFNCRKFSSTLVLIPLFLFFCSAPSAYELAHTTSGAVLKWHQKRAVYLLNPSGGPEFSLSAVQAAMKTWSDVSTSDFNFSLLGPTTDPSFGRDDGQNIISFGPLQSSILAQNRRWFRPQTGEIYDSDIRFNVSVAWSRNGSPDTYDLQSTVIHELGHTLNLADLYGTRDAAKTMFGSQVLGETHKRTLDPDDMNGITFLFPAEATASDGGGDSGGCFIATAAYGNYEDPHVIVLRKFRDRHLNTNAAGRHLVKLYYRVSPPIARLIAKHGVLRGVVRRALTPVVYGIRHPEASILLITLSAAGLTGLLGTAYIRKKRPQ